MGWLGDGSHRGQGCQAWTAVGLPTEPPLISYKDHMTAVKHIYELTQVERRYHWSTVPVQTPTLVSHMIFQTSTPHLMSNSQHVGVCLSSMVASPQRLDSNGCSTLPLIGWRQNKHTFTALRLIIILLPCCMTIPAHSGLRSLSYWRNYAESKLLTLWRPLLPYA